MSRTLFDLPMTVKDVTAPRTRPSKLAATNHRPAPIRTLPHQNGSPSGVNITVIGHPPEPVNAKVAAI